MIGEWIHFVLANLETGHQPVGDGIPNTTSLQQRSSRIEKEKLFHVAFFFLLQTYLVKTLGCTDGLKYQRTADRN